MPSAARARSWFPAKGVLAVVVVVVVAPVWGAEDRGLGVVVVVVVVVVAVGVAVAGDVVVVLWLPRTGAPGLLFAHLVHLVHQAEK